MWKLSRALKHRRLPSVVTTLPCSREAKEGVTVLFCVRVGEVDDRYLRLEMVRCRLNGIAQDSKRLDLVLNASFYSS